MSQGSKNARLRCTLYYKKRGLRVLIKITWRYQKGHAKITISCSSIEALIVALPPGHGCVDVNLRFLNRIISDSFSILDGSTSFFCVKDKKLSQPVFGIRRAWRRQKRREKKETAFCHVWIVIKISQGAQKRMHGSLQRRPRAPARQSFIRWNAWTGKASDNRRPHCHFSPAGPFFAKYIWNSFFYRVILSCLAHNRFPCRGS